MTFHNAHAAQIDADGTVLQVIVIPFCNDDDAEITAYCNSIGLEGTWIDTSYLGSRRGRYAGIGGRYDAELDIFIAPQPYPSWVLDENHEWQAPVPRPDSLAPWVWNEELQEWQD